MRWCRFMSRASVRSSTSAVAGSVHAVFARGRTSQALRWPWNTSAPERSVGNTIIWMRRPGSDRRTASRLAVNRAPASRDAAPASAVAGSATVGGGGASPPRLSTRYQTLVTAISSRNHKLHTPISRCRSPHSVRGFAVRTGFRKPRHQPL